VAVWDLETGELVASFEVDSAIQTAASTTDDPSSSGWRTPRDLDLMNAAASPLPGHRELSDYTLKARLTEMQARRSEAKT